MPKTRRNKIFLLLGIVLSLWGIKIILQPKYYNPIYRRELDFTGYNAPFGILLIIVGIVFVLTTLRDKTEAGKGEAPLLIRSKGKMKKGSLAFGMLVVVVGCLIIVTPEVKRALVVGYFDFTGFNIPFGALLIVVGLVCIWFSFPKKGREYQSNLLICPKCETVRTSAEMGTSKCANCGGDLEDLKGFYDRHPQLKRNDSPLSD